MQTKRRISSARSVLFWMVLGFLVAQLALNVLLELRYSAVNDKEYARRLDLLRARLSEEPGRPLLLLLGSSRTEMNFLPEELPPLRTASGQQPLPFNFSHLGAGPVMNLLELRRLLRAGIRPEWLVLEVMPPQLGDVSQHIITDVAGSQDLPLTGRYDNPLRAYGVFVRGRLVPCYKHRMFLTHKAVPQWAPAAAWQREQIPANGLGRLGGDYAWMAAPKRDPIEAQRRTQATRDGYRPNLQDLRIADISGRALHETLNLCRDQHIPVVLLLSPEGKDFQSWYSPDARRLVDDYPAALAREYDVPLIDARDWLDECDFIDSHHTVLAGAKRFTLRLGTDVLQPFVEGDLRTVASRVAVGP
jgi:hypothetical protein